MKGFAERLYAAVVNPPADETLEAVHDVLPLPVIWLLGKTGAGKTSVIRQLTGDSSAAIGNGFRPCTSTSGAYDFPVDHPIVRFIDTRGLGEAEYDPEADVAELGTGSHALLVVIRLDDPEQSVVLQLLQAMRKRFPHIGADAILAVYTGRDLVAGEAGRLRTLTHQQAALEAAWGNPVANCLVDFSLVGEDFAADNGAAELRALLADKLPQLGLWLQQQRADSKEQTNFQRLRAEVHWYAATAAASDAVPVVGLASVPLVQGKLLHSLARRYGTVWDRRSFSEFAGALGSSVALKYALGHGARQLGKLVPGYGQLVGTALSMSVSYASTWAIGRAACYYLYQREHGLAPDPQAMRALYRDALGSGRQQGAAVAEQARHEK
ncbi:GTPase [Haliea sp. E1-2-M8]|uniref:YcjF family protein n=1 Tax=Haliea sp. E1-2-M8 TaxID=3064706 RepID=UPI0027283421|nr:GTPase [Haliea sp. E1-2-M8]MDO8861978.1 GTPase [Haliea sp. E1-2-M8]